MEKKGEDHIDFTFLDCVLETFPEDQAYKQILNDIEEKLNENAMSMEEGLQNLKLEVNEMCGSEMLKSNQDCLHWLNNYHSSCVETPEAPHSDVIGFLRTLQHFLKNSENQEDIILEFLFDLNNECRVYFLTSPSLSSSQCISQTSLHAVDDDSPMDIQAVWDDIRLHLRRHLVGKLQICDSFNTESNIRTKTYCLRQFLFLYPEKDVLTKYQNIRRNYMKTFLHSEDRSVEAIYHDSVPKVFSMLKEDLSLLRNIMDAPLIIKFIKETYFEAVIEEINIFDILCETNTNPNSLYSTKHSKCKQKQKFDLKSEKVESAVSKYVTSTLQSHYNLETNTASRWPSRRANSSGQGSAVYLHLKDKGHTFEDCNLTLKFDWKNILKKNMFHSLLQSLPAQLENFSIQILKHENEWSSVAGSQINLISVPTSCDDNESVAEKKKKPKTVAKFCLNIIEEFDFIFPLALACYDDSLLDIRCCFVETFKKVAVLILSKLEECTKQFPCRVPLKSLHVILSSAVYVVHHFKYYKVKINQKALFLALIQQYQEFINNLQIQIIDYCISVCSTCIFQDAESHHWDDNKAFFEGERCSFSIEMWYYFCCSLRHDLWTILPPSLAKAILKDVLEQTLALLALRYSQVQPNYKRVSQIRHDILAIFSCVKNMLWSICNSAQDFISQTQCTRDTAFKIHNHCNSLIPVMVVLSAPLETLHGLLTKHASDSTSSASNSRPVGLEWLIYMETDIFSLSFKTPSAVEMAARGQLKLLLSQPYCNWNLLLETLLHSDCLVAKTLLTCSISEISKCNDNVPESDPCLAEMILTVFSYCTLSPKSFTSIVVTYMDQQSLWEYLYSQADYTFRDKVPYIIRYLKEFLKKTVQGLLKQVFTFILSWERIVDPESCMYKYRIPERLLNAVPKQWKFLSRENRVKASQKRITKLTAEAVSIVIRKLPSVTACVPSPIKYFYLFSESKIPGFSSLSNKAGILIWNLIQAICEVLGDGNTIEHVTGSNLSRWCNERLAAVCGCLQRINGNKNDDFKVEAQKVIDSIEEEHPNWIENQFLKAKNLSRRCDSALQVDSTVLNNQTSELEMTEQKINMMVLDICHKPGCSKYLRQIYHIIQLNEVPSTDWSSLLPCCLYVDPHSFTALLEH
ncbi:hypothetical protein GDO86_002236, partial [Hymenochirus boettgeri]